MKLNCRLESAVRSALNLGDVDIDGGWTSADVTAWDSLGHLNLILAVEQEFGVQLGIEETFEVVKLTDLEEILKKKKVI